MMSRKYLIAALTFAASLSLTGMAHATAVPGLTLFNTGVDANGALLADGEIDAHYTIVSSTDATFDGPEAYVTNAGFPIGPWIANSAVSKWISPRANAGSNNEPGQYTYRTTVDLTNFDPTTVSIIGRWTSDNNGVDILVNGVSTGNTTAFESFRTGFTSFSLGSHFVTGLNTIDFIVNNGTALASPTGLRVELSGTALPVPEPETWAMLAAGLGLLGLGTTRRRNLRIGG